MPKPTLAGKLVVAISSRALFDLTESHRIYTVDGVEAYHRYQLEHENEILAAGPAFVLVKKLLRLNRPDKQYVEVILLSRNSADTGLRVFNSIKHYGLDITRAAFTKGEPTSRYVPAFGAHLFLSADQGDVRRALDEGHAAATIFPSGVGTNETDELRIAFDGDAVLFSDEAERVYQQDGLAAFSQSEADAAKQPLTGGPFKEFLAGLHRIQADFPEDASPIRTALVTARSAPGARARDPDAARVEHPDRRGAFPRRTRQGRVPARIPRRHLLRRPAHARRIGDEARRRRPRSARHRQRRASAGPVSAPANPFTLADWRHTVAEHYVAVRALSGSDGVAAWTQFRAARERLFREHPDSPITPERRRAWPGLDWHPYDDAMAPVAGSSTRRRRARRSRFRSLRTACCDARAWVTRGSRSPGMRRSLAMYWFEGYGGGLWLPFSDASSGTRNVRRRPLSLRHDQGRRPRHRRFGNPARFQLCLQPIVRVRRPLVVPAVAAGKSAAVRGARRRADTRLKRRDAPRSVPNSAGEHAPVERILRIVVARRRRMPGLRPANRRALRLRRSTTCRSRRRSPATARACAGRR